MSYPGPNDASQQPDWYSGQPSIPESPPTPGYPTPYVPPAGIYQNQPQHHNPQYHNPQYAAPVSPAGQYGQPAYGAPAYGAGFGFDPTAPYGRDPYSGEPLSDKSKVAAGLLQLFLGGFGAGRFYLGHNGIAVAQLITLVLGWLLAIVVIGYLILFGLGIWVLVDAIIIFTGGVRDSRGFKLRS